MRHIRLVIEYDGTHLSGWQRQSNGPTVQGHLEDALATLLTHPVSVMGASRTDAGVHARGQIASFRTERTIPLHGIRRGVNSMLPDTIAVRDATEVDDDFHPRFSATGKHYRYTILHARDRSPRWRDRAWHVCDPLGHDAMLGATVRRIDSIELAQPEPDLLAIEVRGNAFLRNMVRILVGTLVEVGGQTNDANG